MRCTRFTRTTRMMAGLLTGLLLGISPVPAGAQLAVQSRPGHGFGAVYDVAHETTLNGSIQEVVTRHVLGSPAGIHLLVAGPQGIVETTDILQSGAPVRIVGAMSPLNGKDYFLVRELTVGGSTVTVRTERGLLVRVHPAPGQRVRAAKTAQGQPNGDAR